VAAGVALIIQTAGTLRSNREAVHDWVERYLTADLFVTPNSPVSALGSSQVMDPGLGRQIRRLSPRQIMAVIPIRYRHPIYQDNEIDLRAVPARQFYETDSNHTRKVPHLDLYLRMSRQPGTALVSENFAALYGVSAGDTIQLSGVSLRVLGTVKDYYGNLGTVIMDWDDCCKQFNYTDRQVDRFEVYLQPGVEAQSIGTKLARNLTALDVKTHREVQRHFSDVIERLYAIAYGQQIVVALVAALGIVTALLIAVLQRRRELGVLRAIGASRAQVIRSVLAEAALMGVLGTIIGIGVGIPLEWYILQVAILEESGFLFPVLIPWVEAGVIAGSALLLAILAGLGPAFHAVRLRIPEAIAHE
jgi:putative ABC transport system permease protein